MLSRSSKIRLKLKIRFLRPFLGLFFGILFTILLPKPAISAERIYLLYGPFKFSLSVEALEIYATEGRITSEFAFYANRFDEPTLLQLRQMLQKRYSLNQVTFYRFAHTAMGEELLKSIGQIISTHPGRNGFYAIRGALILAATHQKDWTLIDVMHHFPTQGISIKTELAMELLTTEELPECIPPSSPSLFESKYDEQKRVYNHIFPFLSYLNDYSQLQSKFPTC